MLTGVLSRAQSKDPVKGVWSGTVNMFGSATPVLINFDPLQQAVGSRRATIDLPKMGLHSVQVDTLMQGPKDDSLRLVVSTLPGSFVGRLSADAQRLTGFLLLAGQRMPLQLQPGKLSWSTPLRPQALRLPLPYREASITFAGGSSGTQLAGTLALPKGRRSVPAVVLVSGSGPHNRHGEQFGHQPFRVLADNLARRGFAVLCYDERGVGASTGRFAPATTTDFAADVAAAVAALRANRRIDAQRIFLIGHSQGSLEVARVAAQDAGVAGIALLSGLAEPLVEVYKARLRAQMAPHLNKSDTTGRADILKTQLVCEAVLTIIAASPNEAAAVAALQQPIPAQGITPEELAYFAPTYMQPTVQDILRQDPRADLRKIRVPVLAVTGALDTDAPAATQLPALKAALPASSSTQLTTVVVPEVTHFLQTIPAGTTLSPYDNPESISPAALSAIGDWLTKQTKQPKSN
ncbi:alpha/beta hydrolase [Hymenobacter cellulosivorans]|uniref:Alpha/beta fold hydrolase n=1 Tax=Hymenobacter cellulosivorans TaxID=2932249 RepID=A0ABY4FDK1_9BACT|nr:alpha/beta fold hydrolase [Hymenobacter cellulosivorans]UOQ54760.1 alpha/beta fold hydrolase [Hymenobacter cellulosivorans]